MLFTQSAPPNYLTTKSRSVQSKDSAGNKGNADRNPAVSSRLFQTSAPHFLPPRKMDASFFPSPSGFPPPRRPSPNDSCIFLPSHYFPAPPSSGRIAPPTRQASCLFRSEIRPASRIICRLHLRPIKLLIPSGLKSDRLFRANGAPISDLSICFSVQVGSQPRLLTLKCM